MKKFFYLVKHSSRSAEVRLNIDRRQLAINNLLLQKIVDFGQLSNVLRVIFRNMKIGARISDVIKNIPEQRIAHYPSLEITKLYHGCGLKH